MFCSKCGNEIKSGEKVCSKCGASQNMAPIQSGYNTTRSDGTYFTSVGGWMGWWLICFLLPIIGPIIVACVTKDPSVKNAILAYILLGVIITALFIVCLIFGIVSFSDLF